MNRYIIFSNKLDRVVLGMTLAGSVARNLLEVSPGVWRADVPANNPEHAYAVLFGISKAEDEDGRAYGGISVLIGDFPTIYGFASKSFWSKW